MYDVMSSKAEEFISDEEIKSCLAYAEQNKSNRELINEILTKAREMKGILAGANVLMPNLSPTAVRKQYELYDNKICTGDEAAECRNCLENRVKSIGYELVTDRGDAPNFNIKTRN